MARDYHAVAQRIHAVAEGETDRIALMATITCELYQEMDGFDWVGFYRVVAPDLLKIGPYQGGHGCLSIPFHRGVCGAVARTGRTQIVPDVGLFPGHIACASSTRSEIVVPVFSASGALIAVLDVDSNTPDAFDTGDAQALETIVEAVFAR